MLDTLAVLPQFAKFQRTRKKDESLQPANGTQVSDILASFLGVVALSRLLSFSSGLMNMADDWFDVGGHGEAIGFLNKVELFYSACSGLNVILLSNFMYHYALSIYYRRKKLILPE